MESPARFLHAEQEKVSVEFFGGRRRKIFSPICDVLYKEVALKSPRITCATTSLCRTKHVWWNDGLDKGRKEERRSLAWKRSAFEHVTWEIPSFLLISSQQEKQSFKVKAVFLSSPSLDTPTWHGGILTSSFSYSSFPHLVRNGQTDGRGKNWSKGENASSFSKSEKWLNIFLL